jgi:hypothetical protein
VFINSSMTWLSLGSDRKKGKFLGFFLTVYNVYGTTPAELRHLQWSVLTFWGFFVLNIFDDSIS